MHKSILCMLVQYEISLGHLLTWCLKKSLIRWLTRNFVICLPIFSYLCCLKWWPPAWLHEHFFVWLYSCVNRKWNIFARDGRVVFFRKLSSSVRAGYVGARWLWAGVHGMMPLCLNTYSQYPFNWFKYLYQNVLFFAKHNVYKHYGDVCTDIFPTPQKTSKFKQVDTLRTVFTEIQCTGTIPECLYLTSHMHKVLFAERCVRQLWE